ncbi:hypothetical protein C0991_001039, partial [Blastosporella zonata]
NNWLKFKTKLISAAREQGLKGYLDGTQEKPLPSTTTMPTTWWGSLTPTCKEWEQRNAFALSMVALNVDNPVGWGVKLDGAAAEAWKSLTDIHDIKSGLRLVNAEVALAAIQYTEGLDIEDHFIAMRTAWGNANNQGAGIQDAKFGMYIVKSLPCTAEWAVLAGTLMTIENSVEIMNPISTHIGFITPNAPPMWSIQALATHTNAHSA